MTETPIRRIQRDPQRHRFQNKAAIALTGVTVFGLIVLSALFGSTPLATNDSKSLEDYSRHLEDNGGENGDYSQFSCRYIYEQVPEPGYQQCQFAKTCNDGEGVWAPFVFCRYNVFSAMTGFILLSPIMIVWMVILFRLLGSTAEDFFSPSLEMFSVKLGLPPRFAGVTLLALGNGAADVSATISAIVNDAENGYKLSLGALTGAAMLVGGLVAGIVVIVADGVPCRGALVRDVTALFITVCVVWGNLSSGTIGPGNTSLFLSLYGLFVCIVLVADVYHRAVVLPRLRAREAQTSNGAIDEALSPEAVANASVPSGISRIITAISNYDNVCSNDTTVQEPTETGEWGVSSASTPAPQSSALQGGDEPIILHGQHGILHGDGQGLNAPTQSTNPFETDGGGDYLLVNDQVDQFCVATDSAGFSASNWTGAFHDGQQEIYAETERLWDDVAYNGDLNKFEKAMLICEFPFMILRKATVPIPCEGYYNRGYIALSIAISPLWFAYYAWSGHEVNVFSSYYVVGFLVFWGLLIMFACLVLRYAPGGEGNMAMAFAAPIAFYGFIIAATWIDFIADHLVSLLDFMGILMHIPGAIMGLTILAWGNSMGDLSANMTMARKGLANMAMTACFAGPVFNILVGLGLGFANLATKTNNSIAVVSLSPPIVTGFVFVILNCATILAVGLFFGKGQIDSRYGYVALGLYSMYVVASIGLEFSKYGSN